MNRNDELIRIISYNHNDCLHNTNTQDKEDCEKLTDKLFKQLFPTMNYNHNKNDDVSVITENIKDDNDASSMLRTIYNIYRNDFQFGCKVCIYICM